METAVVTSLISGMFAVATAVVSVWLKHYLEGHHRIVTVEKPRQAAGVQGIEFRSAPRRWSASRPFLVLVAGFIVGIVTRAVRSVTASGDIQYGFLLAIIVLGGSCLVLALNHRKSQRGFWPYQLEVLALWAAFTSGWSLVHGSVLGNVLATTSFFWFVCACVGGLVFVVGK